MDRVLNTAFSPRLASLPVKIIIGLALLVLAFSMPYLLPSNFYLHIANMVLLNALIVLGLWLIFSVGQLSLCHSAFSGFGGYASALLAMNLGLPPVLSIPLSAVLAGVLAWGVGRVILKLRGVFFVLVTFLLAQIFVLVTLNWASLTKGANGLSSIPPLKIFGLASTSRFDMYYIALVALLIAIWAARRVETSDLGRVFRSVHDDPALSESISINAAKFQMIAFVGGSMIAALGGGLYTHYIRFIAPDSFSFHFGVILITMLVVGGRHFVWGAVLGAVFLTPLPELLRKLDGLQHIVYGVILIAVLLFMPNGILGFFAKVARNEQR